MSELRHLLWAQKEFGQAELGDARRRARLVEIGAAMAARPGGTVTGIFPTSASREGAYRFLQNEAIDPGAIAHAAHIATARRCFGEPFVFVPTDGSSLNTSDPSGRRGVGIVGTFEKGARGLEVMSSIVVRRDGTPLGLCNQRYWSRTTATGVQSHDYDARPVEEKETWHWLASMSTVAANFAAHAPGTKPWFQLDAGADAGPVLQHAVEHNQLVTVRACQNRRLMGKKRTYLWNRLRQQEPSGSFVREVIDSKTKRKRTAHLHVQFCSVVLSVAKRTYREKRVPVPLWAVRVSEIDTAPSAESRVDWLLLTTHPVHTVDDALLVADGYVSRWRIEDFHKTWKSGACRVEDTQLQARDHIERFAIISASVAMRIQRLTHLARTEPDLPATVELSRAEIDGLILLRKPPQVRRGSTPTIGQAVRWLADIGGFVGPATRYDNSQTASKRRLPGATVIARGLQRLEPVALLLAEGTEL